jgi:2,4-diketo-3-deoxy-L-fuconate hydrolase
MRLANIRGRSHVITGEATAIDVAETNDDRFGADPQSIYDRWDDFVSWAEDANGKASSFEPTDLGCPVPRPGQVFAIGLNYRDHAKEANFVVPESPTVFTKFRGALTGPTGIVTLPPGGHTDWEVELVVVIGRRAEAVAEADAWGHVAGVTVGQDLSERIIQMAGPVPQFGLGKSFPRFAPLGPWVVTADELVDRDDIGLGCSIDGETMQEGRTRDLVFPVPALIAYLSGILPLEPGDIIFTGTPSGVGVARDPQRFIQPGEVLTSWIDGVGTMRHEFVAAANGR